MGMDEPGRAAKAKWRDAEATAVRRSIYELATCLHLRKTRKHGEMARTAQQTGIARAHGGARRAVCRCSSAACRARWPGLRRRRSEPFGTKAGAGGDREGGGGRVQEERRERRVQASASGHRPGSRSFFLPLLATTPSDSQSPSVLRLLGVAPGCPQNLPLEGRITTSFRALDRVPVQFLSLPCKLIRFSTCSTMLFEPYSHRV
jgi:hypothetical protein